MYVHNTQQRCKFKVRNIIKKWITVEEYSKLKFLNLSIILLAHEVEKIFKMYKTPERKLIVAQFIFKLKFCISISVNFNKILMAV